MPFPSSIVVGTETWSRETCSDGFVYRVTGIQNPHITIHGASDDKFRDWTSYPVYHVIFGTGDIHEYIRDEVYAFEGGKKSTNKGRNRDDANALAGNFWAAMKYL